MPPRSNEPPPAEGLAEAEFPALVRAHQARVYRFLLKRLNNPDDASELTQETFCQAFRLRHSFRGEAQVSSWLLGIALNLARNFVTRTPTRRFAHLSDDALADMADDEADPERITTARRLALRLAAALEDLSEEMRDAFTLVCLEGLSYEQAAQILAVPIGTVRSRLSRARSLVRAAVEEREAVA